MQHNPNQGKWYESEDSRNEVSDGEALYKEAREKERAESIHQALMEEFESVDKTRPHVGRFFSDEKETRLGENNLSEEEKETMITEAFCDFCDNVHTYSLPSGGEQFFTDALNKQGDRIRTTLSRCQAAIPMSPRWNRQWISNWNKIQSMEVKGDTFEISVNPSMSYDSGLCGEEMSSHLITIKDNGTNTTTHLACWTSFEQGSCCLGRLGCIDGTSKEYFIFDQVNRAGGNIYSANDVLSNDLMLLIARYPKGFMQYMQLTPEERSIQEEPAIEYLGLEAEDLGYDGDFDGVFSVFRLTCAVLDKRARDNDVFSNAEQERLD